MTTETTTPESTEAQRRLKVELDRLARYSANIEYVRKWIRANKEKLSGLYWTASHIMPEISIDLEPGKTSPEDWESDPRKVIARFPGVLWKRTKNLAACGSLHWEAEATEERPLIRIENAETIQWTPTPGTIIKCTNGSQAV